MRYWLADLSFARWGGVPGVKSSKISGPQGQRLKAGAAENQPFLLGAVPDLTATTLPNYVTVPSPWGVTRSHT